MILENTRGMGTRISLVPPTSGMELGVTGVSLFLLALIMLVVMRDDPNGHYSDVERLIVVIFPVVIVIAGIVRHCRE